MAEVRNEAINEVRKEYIEREALIEKLMNLDPPGFEHSIAGKVAIQVILASPAADVVEVRRGEWVERDGKTWCSLCDKSNKQYKTPFCPHCGADMRESGKAEEDKEVKIGEMFSEMKLVIHEDNGMMFTEVDGKIEPLPNSTVGIKLTYRGEQYGVVRTFEKPKLDTVDIVTAVNSMFEDLKDAEAFRL